MLNQIAVQLFWFQVAIYCSIRLTLIHLECSLLKIFCSCFDYVHLLLFFCFSRLYDLYWGLFEVIVFGLVVYQYHDSMDSTSLFSEIHIEKCFDFMHAFAVRYCLFIWLGLAILRRIQILHWRKKQERRGTQISVPFGIIFHVVHIILWPEQKTLITIVSYSNLVVCASLFLVPWM